jgi:hypothetical protein
VELTRENYLALTYPKGTEPENEMELPPQFRK